MSKYDNEREAMGLTPVASSSSTGKSKYDSERSMYKNGDEEMQYANAMKSAYQSNPTSFTDKTPTIDPSTQPNNRPDLSTDYPGGWFNPVNDLNAFRKTVPGQFIDSLAQSAGKRMGLSSDQMSSPASTGNKTADSIANFAGDVTGYIANPAQLEVSTGNLFFDNPLINIAASKFGNKTMSGMSRLVDENLSRNVIAKALSKSVEGATKGALGSAAYAPFQTLEQGQDIQDIQTNMMNDTIAGATLGGAFGGLGSLAKSALGRLRGNSVTAPNITPLESEIKPLTDTPLQGKDEILHADPAPPEPVRLTPSEIAQRDRIEKFSQTTDNLGDLPNTADQIQTKTGKDPSSMLQKVNTAYIKGVDNLHRVNQFDKTVEQVMGDLTPSDSTYKLALNSRGSDMVARQILEKNMVDSQGNVIGSSLKDVASQIPKGEEAAFNDYLVLKHSITRMGRGEKVYADDKGMTIQKAESKVAQYENENPQFKEAADQYYEYNRNLGKAWLVDTGILSQKQWDGYLEANPHYVPNNRIFSNLEQKQQFGSKSGFANQTNPVKVAEGSQRKIVKPIESTIENTAKYVKTAKQNEVAQTLYRNFQKDPEAFKAWGEIVGDQPKADINQLLHDEGVDGIVDEIAKSFEKKPDLTKGNIISAMVDGERVHMRIHDAQLLEAMTNLSPQAQHFIMDTVGKVTNTMKVLTTGINPVFGLTRNIFRDLPHAFISSKTTNNPLTFSKDLVESIFSVLKDGELYNSYKNIGGGHSSSVAADRNLLAQSKEKILPSKGLGELMKRVVTKPYHMIENFNNAIESAPRLGEFKRYQNGTYDSKIKGLHEANDLTVNFNKFGNYTKQADALFPYINAAVQGLDQFVRMSISRPKPAAAKAIAALTLPTIALYAINHNNPDYEKVSNFTKDNFFLIPKGDGTFFKIAKPRELGMVFSTGVERILKQINDHDPRAFQDFGHNFLHNFLPPGISGAVSGLEQKGLTGIPQGILGDTVAGPIQSLSSNKDFAQRPIVPQDLLGLSPGLQYDTKTSEPAKMIGGLFNTSPKQLDYLAKSYLGVIGQLGIPAATKGGSILDTLNQQVTVDPAFSNDISRNFYDQKAKADTAKADSKVTGIPLEQDLSPYYDKLSSQFSKIRKQMKIIQKDDSLNNDDKRARIRTLQEMMNEIQLKATK